MAGGIPNQGIDFQGMVSAYFGAKDAAERRNQREWERERIGRQDDLEANRLDMLGQEKEREARGHSLLAEIYANPDGPKTADLTAELQRVSPQMSVQLAKERAAQGAQQREQVDVGQQRLANLQRAMASAKTPQARAALEEQAYRMHQQGLIPAAARGEVSGPRSTPEQIEGVGVQADAVLGPDKAQAERAAKLPEIATDLRKEFQASPEFKAAQTVQTAYHKIRKASDNAAGHMALIFSYMKLMDPGSTVREGEYATAKNAQGVDGRIKSMWNSLVDGRTLSPAQFGEFKREAGQLYAAQRKSIDQTANEYRRLATQANVDPRDVVLDLWGSARPAQETPDAAATVRPEPRPVPEPADGAAAIQRITAKLAAAPDEFRRQLEADAAAGDPEAQAVLNSIPARRE